MLQMEDSVFCLANCDVPQYGDAGCPVAVERLCKVLFYERMVRVNGFKQIKYLQVACELFANVVETSFHQYVWIVAEVELQSCGIDCTFANDN